MTVGQLEELYVPRSMLQAEEKRRQDTERRLAQILTMIDPQSSGGPIYAVPFPEPGDLAKRVLGFAEELDRGASDNWSGDFDVSKILGAVAKQLRGILLDHAGVCTGMGWLREAAASKK